MSDFGMAAEYRVIVRRSVSPDTAVGWLAQGKVVVAATAANAGMFASIAAALATLAAMVKSLDDSQTAAANGGRVEMGTRNVTLKDLKASYRAVASGVQILCDATDADHAREIAAAAGFDVNASTAHRKAPFAGTALGNGVVHLYVKRPGKRGAAVFMEWQMSLDAGVTWLSLPSTNEADTVVSGLTSATVVRFRFRATVKRVLGTWSDALAILVH